MKNDVKKTGSGLMAKAEAINEALVENQKKIELEEDLEKQLESDVEKKKRSEKKRSKRNERKSENRKHSGVNRILTKIIIILFLLCSLAAGGLFAIYYFRNTFFSPGTPVVPVVEEKKSIIIQDELIKCQEFVSMKYRYSDVVSIKKSTKIGFSKSYSIIKYSGIIRVGISDMKACTYEVSEDDKSVVVTLPEIEVLGNDITEQEVFDEQHSIFVPITLDEVFTEIDRARDEVLDEVKADGIMDEAREYAKMIVHQILLSAGYEEVTVL